MAANGNIAYISRISDTKTVMETEISYFRGSENGHCQYNSHGHRKSQVLGPPLNVIFDPVSFHRPSTYSRQYFLGMPIVCFGNATYVIDKASVCHNYIDSMYALICIILLSRKNL